MTYIHCKKCGQDFFLSSTYANVTDFPAKCSACGETNTVTLENGELRKQG